MRSKRDLAIILALKKKKQGGTQPTLAPPKEPEQPNFKSSQTLGVKTPKIDSAFEMPKFPGIKKLMKIKY